MACQQDSKGPLIMAKIGAFRVVDQLELKTGSEIVVSDFGHFFNNGRYYHLCELVGNVFEKGRIPGL